MTIQEQQVAFKLGYDSLDTQGYPGFEPAELDFFINRAIERFYKTRYSGNNVKGESVEETQKRTDDLRTMFRRNPASATTIASVSTGLFSYLLPDGLGTDPKYLFLISCTVGVNVDECGDTIQGERIIKARQITHDQLDEYLRDPFHKPDLDECLYVFEGDKVFIYTGGLYTVKSFNMVYLTYPAKVDSTSIPTVDCDLPAHTHQEIVDIAVRLCIAAVEDTSRLQIDSATIREQE